ncbi:HNH endonuclease [Jannaschia sp. R86511]|uniref:HNH endonuclease n=1 Tax=Jannaschia sp. R86511 TaxID=3093853 RepID=UPI0036D38AC1
MTRGGSTRAWRALRAAVAERDGYRCTYPQPDGHPCRQYAPLAGPGAGHADHVVPVKHGGTDTLTNLRWLCAPHNLGRGTNPDPAPLRDWTW